MTLLENKGRALPRSTAQGGAFSLTALSARFGRRRPSARRQSWPARRGRSAGKRLRRAVRQLRRVRKQGQLLATGASPSRLGRDDRSACPPRRQLGPLPRGGAARAARRRHSHRSARSRRHRRARVEGRFQGRCRRRRFRGRHGGRARARLRPVLPRRRRRARGPLRARGRALADRWGTPSCPRPRRVFASSPQATTGASSSCLSASRGWSPPCVPQRCERHWPACSCTEIARAHPESRGVGWPARLPARARRRHRD